MIDTLVVIVDGHGQHLLRLRLADDALVEVFEDLGNTMLSITIETSISVLTFFGGGGFL